MTRIVGALTEGPGAWLAREQKEIDHLSAGQMSSSGMRVKLADRV